MGKDLRDNLLHGQGHMPAGCRHLSLATVPSPWSSCFPQSPSPLLHDSGHRNLLFTFHISIQGSPPCPKGNRIHHWFLCSPASSMQMAALQLKHSYRCSFMSLNPRLNHQPLEGLCLYPKRLAQGSASNKDFLLAYERFSLCLPGAHRLARQSAR